jgi:hypothetical protein
VSLLKKTFTFEVSKTFEMSPEEIWPDGDGPEDPTLEDVFKEIEKCGGAQSAIYDWYLTDELDLAVEGRTVP